MCVGFQEGEMVNVCAHPDILTWKLQSAFSYHPLTESQSLANNEESLCVSKREKQAKQKQMNKHKETKDNTRNRKKLQKNIILKIMGWLAHMNLFLKHN